MGSMMQHLDRREQERQLDDTYQSAISSGLLEPQKIQPDLWEPPTVPPIVREIGSASQNGPWPRYQCDDHNDVGRATTRQVYQDSFVYNDAPPGEIFFQWVYPLCRFVVKSGEVGIVRLLWTWIEWKEEGTGPIDSGSPAGIDPLFYARNDLGITWHLKLYQGAQNSNPPQLAPTNWIHHHGVYYKNPSRWSDNRFAWGTPAGQVFLVVPSDHILFLACEVANNDTRSKINFLGARLQGYTQAANNRLSVENVRHGWRW